MKNFGFVESFINWIKILLNDQQSCVISGGFAKYFILKRGTCQGDPISKYHIIIAFEVLFALIKNKDFIP